VVPPLSFGIDPIPGAIDLQQGAVGLLGAYFISGDQKKLTMLQDLLA